jgi:hypothetical protein
MASTSDDDQNNAPPLWSIGLIVLLMLGIPAYLYSIAPSGPIREGDTVFSEGAIKVALTHPSLYDRAKFDGTCLLDPQDPLMVLQRPSDKADGFVLAKVQGKTTMEWPFCPPQAEIILAIHQIAQKPDALAEIKKSVREWWSR